MCYYAGYKAIHLLSLSCDICLHVAWVPMSLASSNSLGHWSHNRNYFPAVQIVFFFFFHLFFSSPSSPHFHTDETMRVPSGTTCAWGQSNEKAATEGCPYFIRCICMLQPLPPFPVSPDFTNSQRWLNTALLPTMPVSSEEVVSCEDTPIDSYG